jgi:CubicO group peptidase (beta-lactamase class C family)
VSELPGELRSFVEALLVERAPPGLAVAVTDRQGLVAAGGFGWADLARRTPATSRTLFEIGSIGKCFTAVLALLLSEEGTVELDAPVSDYLPWFEVRGAREPITLQHLLTHTAGLVIGADQSSDSRFDVWALRDTEAGFPPGRHFHYSNVGFRALGYALEERTGRRYPGLVQARVLDPLGLDEAAPAITNDLRPSLAVGYEHLHDDRPPRRGEPLAPATWLETSTADGCLALHAEDLAAFLRLLLNRGEGLLSEESFKCLTTPVIESEDAWSYGYGLEVRTVSDSTQIRHGGSMVGYSSMLLGDLDAGVGVAVLANGPDEESLTETVAAAALALYREGTTPPPPRDPLTVDDGGEYEGTYSGRRGRLVVRVVGDRLLVDRGGAAVPLEQRSNGLLADHADFATFLFRFRRQENAVVEAMHGGDVYLREGEPAPQETFPAEWTAYPGHFRSSNPWLSNFRVVARHDRLVLVHWWGLEESLEPLADRTFRVGDEAWSPERLCFDAIVDGHALRANLSGCDYYRLP